MICLWAMTGWCGDQGTTITPGTKNMYIYSSFTAPTGRQECHFNPQDIAKVNWLFNNLGNFAGFITPTGNVITSGDITQARPCNTGCHLGNHPWRHRNKRHGHGYGNSRCRKGKLQPTAWWLGCNSMCCIQ
jgi:hypothetical protein